MVPLSLENREKSLSKLHDSSFKGAFLRSKTAVLYWNQERFRKGEKLFTVCKEPFMTISVVLYMRKNFFLVDAINDKISMLQSAGLIEFWHSKAIDERITDNQKNFIPKPLKLKHLLGCFVLWGFGIIAASIEFLFEVVIKLIKK